MVEASVWERLPRPGYGPPVRAERFIAAGRVILAVLSLVAIWLDPLTPAQHAHLTYILLTLYAVYALILVVAFWSSYGSLVRLRLATHVLDMAAFTLFMYLTEGPSSPFFAYFTFALVAATLRWQWRGALWTALAAFVAFNGIGWYASTFLADPAFELNRFVIRGVYLAVIASLLGYLGFYQQRRGDELLELAAWPRTTPRDRTPQLREVLESAARVLAAPRALLAWEEQEEPWLQLTLWTAGGLQSWREPPQTFRPQIAEPLAEETFLCRDAGAASPLVLHGSSESSQYWRGPPLNDRLRSRFGVRAVLGVPLRGECFRGQLLALDKQWMTADDLMLAQVVARQTTASLDVCFLSERLRRSAALEERIRLARELHDGVMQTLSGTGLQLHGMRRLLETKPEAARQRLDEIAKLITDEQRDLRLLVEDLKPDPFYPLDGTDGDDATVAADRASLAASLTELARRVETVWGEGLQIRLRTDPGDLDVPGPLAGQLYRLIREALVNAARHAEASEVDVTVSAPNGNLRIVVTDNGRGFAFHGRLDHAALAARGLGPVSLRERVTDLGGTLSIDSAPTGARLEIDLPHAAGTP